MKFRSFEKKNYKESNMQTRSQTKKAQEKSSLFSMVIEVTPPEESTSTIAKLKSFFSNMENNRSSENIVLSKELMTESNQSAQDVSVPPSITPSRTRIESMQASKAVIPVVAKNSFVSRFCNITGRVILFAVQTIPSI